MTINQFVDRVAQTPLQMEPEQLVQNNQVVPAPAANGGTYQVTAAQ